MIAVTNALIASLRAEWLGHSDSCFVTSHLKNIFHLALMVVIGWLLENIFEKMAT